MYYLENRTQETIAKQNGVSRATVVRLLAEGREKGLVRISIQDPMLESLDLERGVQAAYGLKEVLVASFGPTEPAAVKKALGEFAAACLARKIREGMTIAVSAGSTMNAVAACLESPGVRDLSVVSMHGGCNERSAINPDDIARSFAEKLGARCYYLNAPALAESRQKRNALLHETRIRTILDLIRNADMAVVGIGDLSAHTLVVTSNLPDGDALISEVLAKGAVGELMGHYFDGEGRRIVCDLDNRIVGIGIDDLKKIPVVVAVAGGAGKVGAIRSILRSGSCNVLITDVSAARELAKEALPPSAGNAARVARATTRTTGGKRR